MDWDDIRSPAGDPPVVIGETLERLSVGELEHRITLLQSEIERVRRELDAKKAHEAKAASVFKS